MVRSPDRHGELMAAGATSVVHSVEELPTSLLDGLVVATPASTHADVLDSLESVALPIFVEKPLTVDGASAARIAQRCGSRLFVMDKWRYHPGVRAIRDLRSVGRLGADVAFDTIRVQAGTTHEDVSCVWTLLPHDLSIALEIFGSLPEPVSASAVLDEGVITEFTSEMVFASGVPMHNRLGIVAPAHTRRVRVVGEDLVATLADGWDEHVVLTTPGEPDGEPVEIIPATGELPLLAELRMFVEHLRGGPAPVSSGAEAAANVAIVERLLELAGVPRTIHGG